MHNIKIDIVIPLYNKEKSIKRTLLSLKNQTSYSFDEIIVVNDGSTDNSLNNIKKFIKEHENLNIKILDQKNFGVSVARNNGIKLSNAEYITLLDADDELGPNYLVEINNLINLYKKEINIFSMCHINIQDKKDDKEFYFKECSSRSNYIIKYPLLSNSFKKNIFCASGITLKRNLLLNNLFPANIKIGEDIYVWEKIFSYNSLAFSKNSQIKINKFAENRAQNNILEYPYYLFQFKKISKDCKNNAFLFSLIIFHLTSLFIEINKSVYNNYYDKKKFSNLLSSQNILFRIFCKIFNSKFFRYIYRFYKVNFSK